MKIKLHFTPLYEADGTTSFDPHVLVDWSLLEPYWVKEDFAGQPDRSKLTGYLKDWFRESRFKPPCISWDKINKCISFSNGRHRLALITKHQKEVPVSLCDQSMFSPEIHRAVIKILTPDDEVILPDLDFVEPGDRIPCEGAVPEPSN